MKISILVIFFLLSGLYGFSQVVIDTLLYPFSLQPALVKSPTCMVTDVQNNYIWVGTSRKGIIKYDGAAWHFYDKSSSGILSDTIVSLKIENSNIYYGTKI